MLENICGIYLVKILLTRICPRIFQYMSIFIGDGGLPNVKTKQIYNKQQKLLYNKTNNVFATLTG